MKQHTPRPKNGRGYGAVVALLLCAAIFFGSAGIVGAQDNKKNKNKKDAPAPTNATPSMSEEQQIDYQISTMLGAWQVGDVEKLHTTYSDDVVFVSGNWAPPVVGWANYSTMYQQQRVAGARQHLGLEKPGRRVADFGQRCGQPARAHRAARSRHSRPVV